jgi:hypothetical protein
MRVTNYHFLSLLHTYLGIVMEVYFGTALKSLAQLYSGDGPEETLASRMFFYVGLVRSATYSHVT